MDLLMKRCLNMSTVQLHVAVGMVANDSQGMRWMNVWSAGVARALRPCAYACAHPYYARMPVYTCLSCALLHVPIMPSSSHIPIVPCAPNVVHSQYTKWHARYELLGFVYMRIVEAACLGLMSKIFIQCTLMVGEVLRMTLHPCWENLAYVFATTWSWLKLGDYLLPWCPFNYLPPK